MAERRRWAVRARASFPAAALLLFALASPLLVSLGRLERRCSRRIPFADPAAWLGPAAVPTPTQADAEGVSMALREALIKVRVMQKEVEQGRLIRSFGKKAEAILATASARAGPAAEDVEVAVDGLLRSLFLRQVALLRQHATQLPAAAERRRSSASLELEKADRQFAASAEDLVRPGSDWSFEADREALKTDLNALLVRDAELLKERQRSEGMRRTAMDVLRKSQKQLERFGEAINGLGGGEPWMLWTTHRLPGTPFEVIGSYSPGKANIEFRPLQTSDPVTAEAGFVHGLTSKNMGLSFNFGL